MKLFKSERNNQNKISHLNLSRVALKKEENKVFDVKSQALNRNKHQIHKHLVLKSHWSNRVKKKVNRRLSSMVLVCVDLRRRK